MPLRRRRPNEKTYGQAYLMARGCTPGRRRDPFDRPAAEGLGSGGSDRSLSSRRPFFFLCVSVRDLGDTGVRSRRIRIAGRDSAESYGSMFSVPAWRGSGHALSLAYRFPDRYPCIDDHCSKPSTALSGSASGGAGPFLFALRAFADIADGVAKPFSSERVQDRAGNFGTQALRGHPRSPYAHAGEHDPAAVQCHPVRRQRIRWPRGARSHWMWKFFHHGIGFSDAGPHAQHRS